MKKILLLISIAVIFGCGGDTLSFTNIVQTQTAENMLGNATPTPPLQADVSSAN